MAFEDTAVAVKSMEHNLKTGIDLVKLEVKTVTKGEAALLQHRGATLSTATHPAGAAAARK